MFVFYNHTMFLRITGLELVTITVKYYKVVKYSFFSEYISFPPPVCTKPSSCKLRYSGNFVTVRCFCLYFVSLAWLFFSFPDENNKLIVQLVRLRQLVGCQPWVESLIWQDWRTMRRSTCCRWCRGTWSCARQRRRDSGEFWPVNAVELQVFYV